MLTKLSSTGFEQISSSSGDYHCTCSIPFF